MKTTAFIFLLAVAGFVSCVKHKTPEPSAVVIVDTVSFSQFVLPLFQANCSTSGCHDAGTSSGSYTFDSYANISANAVDALHAMKGEDNFELMPQGAAALSDTLIAKYQAWISQGKLNN